MNRTRLTLALLAVLAFGCESAGPPEGSVRLQDLPSICGEQGAPAGCDESCTSDSGCSAGTYCDNGLCIAVCTAEGEQCGSVGDCTLNGRCVPVFSDGGVISFDGSVCGELELATDRVIPNIMVIVDRSGSMRRDFEGDCPFTGNGCPARARPTPTSTRRDGNRSRMPWSATTGWSGGSIRLRASA